MMHGKRAPVISVVLSTFNAEKYISQCIQSLLKQSFEDFELVVIDDGSTDNSAQIIRSFMKADHRIRLLTTSNRGLPSALNLGISIARGKYIARMDADDVAHPERLQKQYMFLEDNADIGVCGTWAAIVNEKGHKTGKILKHPRRDLDLKAKLFFSVCFVHPSVMMRRKLIEQSGKFYDESYRVAQDYDLWVRLAKRTKFYNLQEELLDYRITTGSLSSTSDKARSELRLKLTTEIYKKQSQDCDFDADADYFNSRYLLASNSRLKTQRLTYSQISKFLTCELKRSGVKNGISGNNISSVLLWRTLAWMFYCVVQRRYLDVGRLLLSRKFRVLLANGLLQKIGLVYNRYLMKNES